MFINKSTASGSGYIPGSVNRKKFGLIVAAVEVIEEHEKYFFSLRLKKIYKTTISVVKKRQVAGDSFAVIQGTEHFPALKIKDNSSETKGLKKY